MKGEPKPEIEKPEAQHDISSGVIYSNRFTNSVSSCTNNRGNCELISLKV